MTDRVDGFFVTLADDVRIDDADDIIAALGMVKGVLDVSPHVANPIDHLARVRVRSELIGKMIDIIKTG